MTTSVPRRADGGAGRRPLPSGVGAAVLAGALALAAWGAVWPAWAAGGGVSVEWDGERLTVHADATPHAAILRAVSRRTGVVVQGTESALGIVSMHFSTLSLRQALGRLAGGLDHVVVEAGSVDGPRPVLLIIFGPMGGHDGGPAAVTAAESMDGAELAREEAARRRLAAEVWLDEEARAALPPGLSIEEALVQVEQGLARLAQLEREMDAMRGASDD